MPATAPIPEEVAKCHTAAGEYGRYVITTGPYMIDGSDKLDISSCGAQKPISGFNPNTGLNLVRNPNYDPATDSPDIAPGTCRTGSRSRSTPTSTTSSTRSSAVSSRARSRRPRTRSCAATSPAPDIREKLRVNAGDRIWYAYMNLTHAALRRRPRAQGDEPRDGPRGHPARVGRPGRGPARQLTCCRAASCGGATDDYDPYQQGRGRRRGGQGRDEAVQVRHRPGRHLRRRPPARASINLNRNFAPWSSMSPIIEQSASKIGVTIQTREASRTAVTTTSQTPSKKTPVQLGERLGQGLRRPDHLLRALFRRPRRSCQSGNPNFSLVGLTAQKAKQVGVDYPRGRRAQRGRRHRRSAPR